MKTSTKFIHAALLLLILLLGNYLIQNLSFKIDLTEGRVYTLSPGSKAVLATLEEPVTIEFYFNRSLDSLPVFFKNYASRVEALLRQFERHGGGMVHLRIIDPRPDSPQEEEAVRAGLRGNPLPTGETLFLGIVITQADQQEAMPFLDPSTETILEYRITSTIDRVIRLTRPRLGLISSLDILGQRTPPPNPMQPQPTAQPWILAQQMEHYFEVVPIDEGATSLPENLDLLAVIHPGNLRKEMEFALDQYLLGGGRLFVALDPSSQKAARSMDPRMMQFGGMPSTSSDLGSLLDGWGIDYDDEKVAGDRDHPTQLNDGRGNVFSLPTWPTIGPTHLNQEEILTNQLGNLLFVEPGFFSVRPGRQLEVTPLITLRDRSGFIHRALMNNENPARINAAFLTTGNDKMLAGMIRGSFRSAFPDGPPAFNGDEDSPAEWLREASAPGLLILTTDVDWLADDFSVRRMNFMGYTDIQPINENIFFASNILEFLSGSRDLMTIRARGSLDRPFTVVQRLQARSLEVYQAELHRLENRLEEVQNQLAELQAQRGEGGRLVLTPEQRTAIEEFQAEEAEMRAKRRKIRQALREDIERLKRRLFLLNLFLTPIFVTVIGTGLYIMRRKRNAR